MPGAEQSLPPEEGWGDDELDLLYQQAVEAMDSVEWEAGLSSDVDTTEPELLSIHVPDEDDAPAVSLSGLEAIAAGLLTEGSGGARNDDAGDSASDHRGVRVTPRQIIEAALFVGGDPLSTRKLCHLLRSEFESGFIEDRIDELNAQYMAENRPYEIRLGEGGYRMVLRHEFERVRGRVYGLGPREVKLNQEALEVLALVAYEQPISREQIEKLGKANAGGVLRQLLRRELICIEREADGGKDVKYRTSPRFLQLFGLGDLDELPRAEELNMK